MKCLGSLRYSLFSKKLTTPALKKLPPIDNSAKEHVKRARLQVLVWQAADQTKAPNVDVNSYRWKLSNNNVVPNYDVKEFAPHDLLKIVACGCQSKLPCSAVRCTSKPCMYCKCIDDQCSNEFTIEQYTPDETLADGGVAED